VGVIAALLVIGHAPLYRRPVQVTGAMLSEHGGAIRSLVMQYTKGSAIVWPVYRQFLQVSAGGGDRLPGLSGRG